MDDREINSLVDSRVREVIKEAHGDLLKDIGVMMNKISAPSSSSSATVSALEAPKFKRRSNEEQFKHNSKVISKLEQAESGIDCEMLSQAKENIIEARDMMKKRQKLIQLADASELGWKVVAEYESNPIASDSEDEKRIYKAEARATRKAKTEKSKKRRSKPYRRYTSREEACSMVGQPSVAASAGTNTGRRPGLCFACGRAGHWKNECPQNSNNKISDIFYSVGSRQYIEKTSNSGRKLEKILNADCSNFKSNESIVVSPVGRLKSRFTKWSEITSNVYILDVIKNGYRLPFYKLPENAYLRNNKSARDNVEFVTSEIISLLSKGIISEIADKPAVINPLTVAYGRSGKPRLVLDCRHVNPCLHLFKIKFEDVKVAENVFQPHSYVFTFDLKSAYHHIDIALCHRSYLGFSWCNNGKIHYYVYNSLPFGVASAGHIFTKVLRVMIAHWRWLCISIVMFLDDGMGGNNDLGLAKKHSSYVRQSLIDVGFLLAEEKCDWEPKRSAVWLGHVFCFEENRLRISTERIIRIENHIDSILLEIQRDRYPIIHVKLLASVIGQIVSLQSTLGKSVSLRTRNLYNCVLHRINWDCMVRVTDAAITELQYWRKNVRDMNTRGRSLWVKPIVDAIVYSDASADGYGGYVEYSIPNSVVSSFTVSGPLSYDKESSNVTSTYNYKNEELCRECGFQVILNQAVFPSETGTQSVEDNCSFYSFNRYMGADLNRHGDLKYSSLPEVSTESRNYSVSAQRLPEASSVIHMPIQNRIWAGDLETEIDLPEASSFRPEFIDTNLFEDTSYFVPTFNCTKWHGVGACKVVKEIEKSPNIVANSEVFGSWTDLESGKSSTWRELEAVRRIIINNLHILKTSRVQIFSDNLNVKRILKAGSRVQELHNLSLRINNICQANEIVAIAEWIPRSKNLLADHLSRCKDVDDWFVLEDIFQILDRKWGPHSIDRFATHYNSRCKRFNSRWWLPGTEAVDCFNQSWKGEVNWLVPPPTLIANCIRKMQIEGTMGTLIIPEWKSASYWPYLTNEEGRFKSFVKEHFILPAVGSIKVGKGNNGVFARSPLRFRMLALKCMFY